MHKRTSVDSPLSLAAGLVVIVTLAACGGGSSEGAGGGGGARPGGTGGAGGTAPISTQPQEANYRPCSRAAKIGGFTLLMKMRDTSPFSIFQGSVYNDVNPLDSLVEVQSVGACRLLNRKVNQCTPACSQDKPLCSPSGCIAFPAQQSVGTLTVNGVADGLTVTPSKANFYTNDGVIPFPGVVEGKDVSLSASGGTYPAFSIATKGIAPLEMITKMPVIKKATPLSLAWKPASQPVGGRIHILVSLDNHGTTPQQIECDAPDTGSFDIPAALVDALTTLGLSGFPTMIIERRAVESTSVGPGCVELNVSSELVLDVQVDGFQSCKKPEDCPSGQTCQPNQSCK